MEQILLTDKVKKRLCVQIKYSKWLSNCFPVWMHQLYKYNDMSYELIFSVKFKIKIVLME